MCSQGPDPEKPSYEVEPKLDESSLGSMVPPVPYAPCATFPGGNADFEGGWSSNLPSNSRAVSKPDRSHEPEGTQV